MPLRSHAPAGAATPLRSRAPARVWTLALALIAACDARTSRCELEPRAIVARTPGLGFDAIAVAAAREGAALFVWSDADGLWARRSTDAAPVRVGARCRGGIDALVEARAGAREQSDVEARAGAREQSDVEARAGAREQSGVEARAGARERNDAERVGYLVACSRAAAEDSEVVVYRLEPDLRARSLGVLGRAGRDGHGVALALSPAGAYVAFHEGSLGEHAVWLARVRGDERTLQRLSPVGVPAGEPALVTYGGHVYAAFSVLELALGREAERSIWVARDTEPPRRVAKAHVHTAVPTLSADDRGLVLGYRDRARLARGDPNKNELYVARLTPEGALAHPPHAIGRANSEGEPSLRGCGPLSAALLPRDYGGERFVGINALDDELMSLGPGHQFYASANDFVLASAACLEHGWLLLTASRGAPGRPGAELAALNFRCAE